MRAPSRRRWLVYSALSLAVAFASAIAGPASRQATENGREAAPVEADPVGVSVSIPGARFDVASGRASDVRLFGSLDSPGADGGRIEVELSRFPVERTAGDLRIALFYGAEGRIERMDVQAFTVEPQRSQWRSFTVHAPTGGVCDNEGTTCVSARREEAGLIGLQGLLPADRCFTTVRVGEARPDGVVELRGEGELLTCGLPAVFTEREHYLAGSAVTISGRGFQPFEAYELAIMRTAPIDVLETRAASGWRATVVADGLGRLSALHGLDETAGTYEVRVHAYRTDAPTETHPKPLASSVILSDYCGNGVISDGEDCDDGGESSTCDDNCTFAECGDGTLNQSAFEACDDGGESGNCDADCTLAECGDGTANFFAGEECDDFGESASCDADCTLAECGDDTTNTSAGEECDDFGESASCDADCTFAECGDGTSNFFAFEDCDDGGESNFCDDDCTFVFCGDGNANEAAGEDCDDFGESASCDDDCTYPGCGDGTTNSAAGEECDDFGESASCDDDCTNVGCGDGNVNESAGEFCDDGTKSGTILPSVIGQTRIANAQTERLGLGEPCDSDCTEAVCGDDTLNPDAGEQCDDGNTTNGDGCSSTCQDELCGDGVVNNVDEECDDGNTNTDDNCIDCQNAFCGDGYVQSGGLPVKAVAGGDECDDGNNLDGDGCTSACTVEPGYLCSGEPSMCADIDECSDYTDNCDANATCTNTAGGFACACNPGFSGDGVTCTPDPTCDDSIQNQGETGVDCGGPCPACVDACPNLLQNGDFSNGTTTWSKFFNTAGATFTVVGGVAQASIVTQTSNGQIYQTPLALLPNTQYRVSFRALNSNGDNVTVQVIKHVAPFTKFGTQVFDLTDVFQDFSFVFTSPAAAVNDGRLMFHFSPHDSPDTLYEIDDVVLELASCSPPPAGCGDGAVDVGEGCDDGNTTSGDGCDDSCVIEYCGDGTINNVDEQCDDGSLNGINGTCSATCTIVPPSGCPNLVQNGDFSSGIPPWKKNFNTAGATFNVVVGVAQANIVTQTSNGQIYQTPLALDANTQYRVSFRARNTNGDDLTVKVIKHVAPFTAYGVEVFDLTDVFQEFTFLFTSPAGAVNDARLMFQFSPHDSNNTSYEFDDVVLQQESCAPPAP